MTSPGDQLVKRARMLRHVHRGLPNVLKARFSPTAIWTTGVDTETSTPRTTSDDDIGIIPVVTRTTSSSTPLIQLPTFSIPTPIVVVTLTTSASSITASSTSTSVPVLQTTSSTTSSILTTSSSAILTTSTPSSTSATSSETTALVTRTVSSHASATSLGSSASATSTGTSGITTTGIVGITAAGIVGAAVVAGLVMFFLRRWNRKQDKFDPDDFKRQSVVLRDDNTSLHRGNSGGRGGFGPRPPTMFERHHQNMATFVTPSANMYQSSAYSYGSANPFSDVGSQPSPSFAPGMYVPGPTASPAPSAQNVNTLPFYNPSMQSPVGTPVTVASYGGAAFDAQGQLVRAPSTAATSMLSRNNSVAHPPYPPEEADYANLTRSSVTPFQAAQYEAISRHLNIPPPKPLHQVSEAEEAEEPKLENELNTPITKDANSAPMASPFEDPRTSSASAGGLAWETGTKGEHPRASSEIHAAPEPGSRVPSKPPSLPEIKMMSGTFSPVTYSFPVSPSPRKGSFDLHSGRASPKVDLPPLSPVSSSPQRAQFVDGLEARAHDGHETPVEIGFVGKDDGVTKTDIQPSQEAKTETPKPDASKAEAPKAGALKPDASKRPETMYADEDAYGGF